MKRVVDGVVLPLTDAELALKAGDDLAWHADSVSRAALLAIADLEAMVTPRRLREAALGDAVAIAFIQSVDDQIAVLRMAVV